MRQLSLRVCLSVVAILLAQMPAQGGEVVVPNALESVEGNFNSAYPFNLQYFVDLGYDVDPMRYQQVYAADDFSSLTEPVLITELRFRPDAVYGGAFSSTLPDVQISLSTSSAGPQTLSANFADNVGADETIVHDGALSLSSSFTGSVPMDFDIVIVLSTPFLYDPSQGNLLMDVRNYGGGSSTFFDVVSTASDNPVGRSLTAVVGDVYSSVADYGDSGGLVTKFIYTPADAPPPPTSSAVVIDVKPGSDENQVNLKDSTASSSSNGKGKAKGKAKGAGNSASGGPVLQVAILTADGYDATSTDVGTVLLGDPLLGGTVAPTKSMLEDVDADGDLDVLMHFSLNDMQTANALSVDSMVLVLTAQTVDGIAIDGMDAVNVKSK